MGRRGFTITELIITMILVSILAFGTTIIFMQGFKVYLMNKNLIELRSEIRVAMNRMAFEIRESEITESITGGFRIEGDFDNNSIPEEIVYQFSGTEITRTIDGSTNVLLAEVSDADFIVSENMITIDITVTRDPDNVHLRTKVGARCI